MTKVRTEQLQEALALGLRVGRTDGTTQVQLEGHGDTLRVSVNVLGDWYQRRLGVAGDFADVRDAVCDGRADRQLRGWSGGQPVASGSRTNGAALATPPPECFCQDERAGRWLLR